MPDIINVDGYEYDKTQIKVILDKKTPEWTPVIVQTPDGIQRPVQVDSDFKGPDVIWRAINAAHHLYLYLEANKDKQAEGGHWFGVALNAGSYHAVCIRGTDDKDIAWKAVAEMLKAYLADEPSECDATIYGTAPHNNWEQPSLSNHPTVGMFAPLLSDSPVITPMINALVSPSPESVKRYVYELSRHPFEPLGGKSSLADEQLRNADAGLLEALMRSDFKELPPSQIELPWVDGILDLFDGTPPPPLPSHFTDGTISEIAGSHYKPAPAQCEALRSIQEELDNLWQSETAARLLMLMKSGEPIIDPPTIDDDADDEKEWGIDDGFDDDDDDDDDDYIDFDDDDDDELYADDDDDWDDDWDDDDDDDDDDDEVVAPDAVPAYRWVEEAAPMTDEDWERIAAVFGLGDEGTENIQKNDSATPSDG